MNGFISNCLSPYLCSYRKGFNTQQALLALIEKWENNLDDKGYGGAVWWPITANQKKIKITKKINK